MTPTEQIEMATEMEATETQPRFDTEAIMEVAVPSRLEAEPVAAVEPVETPAIVSIDEFQISDAEKDRWIWTFERLKTVEIGLSLSEKIKIFCEVSSPEEVDSFIQARLDDQKIIPLAA